MLKHLTIKNYALIDSLETSFFDGFSVITGETGAGKSIILGALSLILGNRADLLSAKNKSKKCVVEGIFDTSKQDLNGFFQQNNLDFDPETTILRREILPSGKSRAFINDTPVSLTQIKELAARVVDIHSQNSAALLQDASFQLNVLDSYCKNAELLLKYKKVYQSYKQKLARLSELREAEAKSGSEQDFFTFQFDELDEATLVIGEQEEIEKDLGVLNHADEIKTRLFNVLQFIEGDHGLNTVFDNILAEFKPLMNYSEELSSIFERLESNYVDISDLSSELNKIDERVDVNPGQVVELNERLSLIYQLQQKHRVSDVESLILLKEDYLQKIKAYSSLETEILACKKDCGKVETDLSKLATQLSGRRKKVKGELETKIATTVALLGMPHARVDLHISQLESLTESGSDKVSFLFNANKGGEMMEMSKIASGGEISRLMLAIKSQIAAKNLVSTIIFDEIDSGVSGEVAGKMAGIMQDLGHELQVISITHLPQIAARGRQHYLVTKDSGDEYSTTSIKLLSQDERIIEIAKMLSDSTISESALQTAGELMRN